MILKSLKKTFAILIVLLFIGGSGIYAEQTGDTSSDEQTLLVKEIKINENELDETLIPSTEDPDISILSRPGDKIELLGTGGGTGGIPSGKFIDGKKAHDIVVKLGYNSVHQFKTILVRGQRDTTISHYNIYRVTKTERGGTNGDIYLQHTTTRNFYNTFYNEYRDGGGHYPIPY
nr:hypothetical protein [Paenibacillus bovis]